MASSAVLQLVLEKKAKIYSDILINNWDYFFTPDDTSSEVLDILETMTQNEDVVQMALALVIEQKEGLVMNEDPGHEEAEQILQDQQDEYYSGLADSES